MNILQVYWRLIVVISLSSPFLLQLQLLNASLTTFQIVKLALICLPHKCVLVLFQESRLASYCFYSSNRLSATSFRLRYFYQPFPNIIVVYQLFLSDYLTHVLMCRY